MKQVIKTSFAALAVSLIASISTIAHAEDLSEISIGLLRTLERGDKDYAIEHVAKDYIQHNPLAADGRAGLLAYIDYLATLENVEITPVRVLVYGDMVAVHSQYSTSADFVVFDIFRFDGNKAVEHWDGTQELVADAVSGRSMTDGPADVTDRDKTEANRQVVESFIETILIDGKSDQITDFIVADYAQHNPEIGDGLDGLGAFLASLAEKSVNFSYSKRHHTVADGNFVMTISEGVIGSQRTAFYDLWRVENGMLAEHWDVIQPIPEFMPHSNGMF